MRYHLDTNSIIFSLKGQKPEIKRRIGQIPPSRIKVSSMVVAELIAGAYNSRNIEETMASVNGFIAPYEIISFDAYASEVYGKIWAELEKNGKRIGSNDLIIAATAMSRGDILITNNTKDFKRIEGLRIEDWSV